VKNAIFNYISSKNDLLRHIGYELWKNPELGLEETMAHDLLTDTLENEGFKVTRNFILITGFKAEYQTSEKPHIVYFCEYDALPIIGHACGHNLIAEAGIGAALGLKYAMEHHDIKCKLTILGSPAEETHGGKISMIQENVLQDVDAAMMVHPREVNSLHMPHCALKDLLITYKGRSAHETASPWEGKNALDAASLAYQGVGCFRKQMQPGCHININIKLDSNKPLGIIPDLVTMEAEVRAPSIKLLSALEDRLKQIVNGAAMMADCEIDYLGYDEIYANLVSNKPLLRSYKSNAEYFKLKLNDITRTGGSTDMGNVSQVVPSIHPVYFIGSNEGPHTEEFVKWTGLEEAHDLTIIQAKILAATGVDIATDNSLIESAREYFMKDKEIGFSDHNYANLY